ncbi:MAG: hypothetical protein ABW163_06505 [Luteimonas sp.]
MKMLRIVAAGALSYFAYRAWTRNRNGPADDAQPRALPDEGARTAPHGDPILSADEAEDAAAPRASAQTSPGFGAP